MFCDISDDSHQWLAHYDLNPDRGWVRHFYYRGILFTPRAARRDWQKWGCPDDIAFFPTLTTHTLIPYLYRDGK
jgi:hypothetical protein